jgi:hypothetical protein
MEKNPKNIKMGLKIRWDDVNCIRLFQDREQILWTWGLFDRASSSWNNLKCQLDATR